MYQRANVIREKIPKVNIGLVSRSLPILNLVAINVSAPRTEKKIAKTNSRQEKHDLLHTLGENSMGSIPRHSKATIVLKESLSSL